MKKIAYMIDFDSKSVTVHVGAKPYTIDSDHCNYQDVLTRLREKDYEDLEDLLDIPKAIAKASNGKLHVESDSVYYNGKEIHNVIVDRILDFMNENFPFESLTLFLQNLLQNPSEDTINECYSFLETGNLPITDDGCFLAYKKVSQELKSIHPSPDGTYLDHAIGSIVAMPREDVDTNRHNTCSKGLHFCSLNYLPNYGGQGRIIIVKVNPRDVCAIPSDYNNTKGRTACYEVVAEYISDNNQSVEAFDDAYVDTKEDVHEVMVNAVEVAVDEFGVKPDGKRFHNKRGTNGRFAPRQ
jgi:hypothetical protein